MIAANLPVAGWQPAALDAHSSTHLVPAEAKGDQGQSLDRRMWVRRVVLPSRR